MPAVKYSLLHLRCNIALNMKVFTLCWCALSLCLHQAAIRYRKRKFSFKTTLDQQTQTQQTQIHCVVSTYTDRLDQENENNHVTGSRLPIDAITGINSFWRLKRVIYVSMGSVALTWPFWPFCFCLSPPHPTTHPHLWCPFSDSSPWIVPTPY